MCVAYVYQQVYQSMLSVVCHELMRCKPELKDEFCGDHQILLNVNSLINSRIFLPMLSIKDMMKDVGEFSEGNSE